MLNSEESEARKFLRHLPYEEGFHFFTGVGKYTGETANGLETFAEEIAVIEEASIRFHVQRDDFQKWIRNTIGDEVLAERISQVDRQLPADNLRKELSRIVQTRIIELTHHLLQGRQKHHHS